MKLYIGTNTYIVFF